MIGKHRVLSGELMDQLQRERIALALNRIVHNSRFKEKVSLKKMKSPETEHFLSRLAHLICECFWVTGVHDSAENYAGVFTISSRIDKI